MTRRIGDALVSIGRALQLVKSESRGLAFGLGILGMASGALPPAIAYLAKLIVDEVARTHGDGRISSALYVLLGLELGAVLTLLLLQRALSVCDALLRVRLSQSIVERVLKRSLELSLADFESPGLQDELRLISEQATERPLSLVRRALIAAQQSVTLLGSVLILAHFSRWFLLLLVAATLPALWIELRLNADAFRLFRAQSPDARRQRYLELLLTREAHAKEVRAYEVGPALLERHRAIFERFYREDRALTLRRAAWGFVFGLVSATALSASYLLATWRSVDGALSIGSLAALFLVLRQAQSSTSDLVAVLAGMHEDQLYLAALDQFLARPARAPTGAATDGASSGIRFDDVSFTYPGASEPALQHITLELPAASRVTILGKNGSGKTTLLKLLTGLYRPTSGTITLDGIPLQDWNPETLRKRFAIVFQDFGHYELSAGENVGIASPTALDAPESWQNAAAAAGADDVIRSLPAGYATQLGHWFDAGRELSAGEWQRVALSRLFVRSSADILVIDEPTANLDPATEQEVLRRLQAQSEGRLAVLVSHRAAWPDAASIVAVLDSGKLVSCTAPGAGVVPAPAPALAR